MKALAGTVGPPLEGACQEKPHQEPAGIASVYLLPALVLYHLIVRATQKEAVMDAQQLLVRSLRTHSRLATEAIQEISSLRHEVREFRAGEDVILQGQVPKFSAIVVSGMVARYHLLANGGRQYLAYHLAGDLPDF